MITDFKSQKSFTILEIMIVVLIVGMITAFGIPRYHRAMENAQQAEIFDNLRIIYAAEQAHHAGTGHYWPTDNANYDIIAINQNLRLNIIENGVEYSCSGIPANLSYACFVNLPDGGDMVGFLDGSLPLCNPLRETCMSGGNNLSNPRESD